MYMYKLILLVDDNDKDINIYFRPLSFDNPLVRGDQVSVMDYALGEVENLFHHHDGESHSQTVVHVNGVEQADGFLLLKDYRTKTDSRLETLIEKVEPL